jgi:ubiquinone/menaquinone biosynthesis C-methylase UbiE
MSWGTFDAASFYDELGRKYPEAEVVYSTLEGRLRRAFVRHFVQSQSGTLLDVGCNVGVHLKGYEGKKIGVDLAPSVLAIAQQRIPDGTFYAGSAEAMAFLADESVDAVLCTEVLEHIEHPRAAFAEFCRVLRKGGRFLVSTPNRLSSQHEDWIEADILEDYGVEKQSYFHTAFAPSELASMAKDVGLAIYDSGSFGHAVSYCGAIAYPFYDIATRVNRHTFHSRRLDHALRRGLFLLERVIYRFVSLVGLRGYLNARVKQGKFSYVVGHKTGRVEVVT